MDTISTIGIVLIAVLQLIYIFVQHVFYNKQIKEFRDNIKNVELELKDKEVVIGALQQYLDKMADENKKA